MKDQLPSANIKFSLNQFCNAIRTFLLVSAFSCFRCLTSISIFIRVSFCYKLIVFCVRLSNPSCLYQQLTFELFNSGKCSILSFLWVFLLLNFHPKKFAQKVFQFFFFFTWMILVGNTARFCPFNRIGTK